jgi:putative ABC transport system substrate-binding protein
VGAALAAARDARASGLLVFNGALFDRQAGHIAALAAKARLPTVYGPHLDVDAGGLMSMQRDLVETGGARPTFVDKILKGAKTADRVAMS